MTAYPATERIARFVAETTLDAVPPAVVDTAKTAFMDGLSVALAGSQDDAGILATRVAREEGAREEASVLERDHPPSRRDRLPSAAAGVLG